MQKEVSNFSDDNFEEKPKESNTETKDNVKK